MTCANLKIIGVGPAAGIRVPQVERHMTIDDWYWCMLLGEATTEEPVENCVE